MSSRILLVSITPFFGGGEVYYAKLGKLLSNRYDLGAVVANERLRGELASLGIKTWPLPSRPGLMAGARYGGIIFRLIAAIRRFRPDVVHLNGQGDSYLAAIPYWLGLKVASTRHTVFDARTASPLKKLLVSKSLHKIHKTVCISSYLRGQLAEVVDSGKLAVIPNWLDEVPPVVSYKPPAPGERLRLLYVGRLVRDKGILDLIEAVRTLQDVSLVVVGDGDDGREVREKALGLPVEFAGFQQDPSRFYRDAHLLIFPSHYEGQGFVPIEAMAHGLPCLLSDIPVNHETADQGRSAELFQCGDQASLARAIRALGRNPQRLAALSEYARHFVVEHYTRSSAEQSYYDLFDALTGYQTKQR